MEKIPEDNNEQEMSNEELIKFVKNHPEIFEK